MRTGSLLVTRFRGELRGRSIEGQYLTVDVGSRERSLGEWHLHRRQADMTGVTPRPSGTPQLPATPPVESTPGGDPKPRLP